MCVSDRTVNPGELTVKIGFDKDGLFFRQFAVSVNGVAIENPVVTPNIGAEESLPVSECVGIQILFRQDSDVRAKEQRIDRQGISLVAKFQHNRLEHCRTGIGPLVRMIGRGQIGHHSPDDGVILLEMKRGSRQDAVVFLRDEIPKDVRVKRFESDKVEIHVHSTAFMRTKDADVVGEMLRFVRTLSPCSAQVPTFQWLFKRRQTLSTHY